jgi:hypothetical protein
MHACRHPFASACAAEQLAHACSKLFVAQWRPTPLHEAFLGSAVHACHCRSSQEQQCPTVCTLATPCGLLCRNRWHISATAPAPPAELFPDLRWHASARLQLAAFTDCVLQLVNAPLHSQLLELHVALFDACACLHRHQISASPCFAAVFLHQCKLALMQKQL